MLTILKLPNQKGDSISMHLSGVQLDLSHFIDIWADVSLTIHNSVEDVVAMILRDQYGIFELMRADD